MAPYLMSGGRWGYRMGDAEIYDSMLRDGLNDAFSDQHSGWHTEDLVTKYQITRRGAGPLGGALAAALLGRPGRGQVRGRDRRRRDQRAARGRSLFAKDEHNRPDTTIESLAKLKPAFRKDGTITAGNAPGLNTGAAAMIVAERDLGGEDRACSPWPGSSPTASARSSPACSASARCRPSGRRWRGPDGRSTMSSASRSTRPSRPSPSPSPANSDFAEDIVNVEGGAIAHGHPIGATGAVLTTRLSIR